MKKENTVGFRLLRLKTEQFATFEENYQEESKESGLLINANFKLNDEQKQIGVFTTFSFEQDKKTFLKIEVSCHFVVIQQDWDKFCNEGKIVFPVGFVQHITAITVGSARGVLHAKTEGTAFNKFLIPTIDVTKMVTENVEFNIPQ